MKDTDAPFIDEVDNGALCDSCGFAEWRHKDGFNCPRFLFAPSSPVDHSGSERTTDGEAPKASSRGGELRKHFEANMLDGDTIQGGQMLSSEAVFEYLEEYVSDLLTQVGEEGPKDKPFLGETVAAKFSPVIGWNESNAAWRKHIEAFRERVL